MIQGEDVVIELENVNKHYQLGKTDVAALKDISLTIEKGEFLSIWGPSGSGKTSLLNIIGLIDMATTGTYKLDNTSINDLTDEQLTELRGNQIGFVFQHFNLIPVLCAEENVALPLEITGMDGKEAKRRALACLERVGLADFAQSRPDKMSGGQRQRVAIARALVTEPLLVVADEPTANLDSETGQAIIDLMRELNVKDNITFVFSTHDPQLLENVHRRIRVKDGQIVDDITQE
ncbi:MAG: putative ABC transport system ATP-binding protein [Alteromonadaceae bacterium]